MTILLKQLFELLKLLNSEQGTTSISAGIVCGMILGFAPFFSLQTLAVVAVIFFFRIQIAAALASSVFWGMIAFFFDPLFHQVGAWVLERPALRPLFTEMANMPLVPLTRFNHSISMGAGVVSLILAFPVFLGSAYFIHRYRVVIVARFKETRFWKAVKATGFYKWYLKYDQFRHTV